MGDTSRLPTDTLQVLAGHLAEIYTPQIAQAVLPRLTSMVLAHRRSAPVGDPTPLTQKDVFLIAYPDQVTQPGEIPLQTRCSRRPSTRRSPLRRFYL